MAGKLNFMILQFQLSLRLFDGTKQMMPKHIFKKIYQDPQNVFGKDAAIWYFSVDFQDQDLQATGKTPRAEALASVVISDARGSQ